MQLLSIIDKKPIFNMQCLFCWLQEKLIWIHISDCIWGSLRADSANFVYDRSRSARLESILHK